MLRAEAPILMDLLSLMSDRMAFGEESCIIIGEEEDN